MYILGTVKLSLLFDYIPPGADQGHHPELLCHLLVFVWMLVQKEINIVLTYRFGQKFDTKVF